MTELKAIYLIVSGAGAARCVPDLINELAQFNLPRYTLLTDSAHNVISPYNLADIQGHTLIESYFNPVLIDERPPGLTVVAPATFNTFNKIAHGIADNLPLSLVAEAIGAGWPVVVAPSMNPALANHPQMAQSLKNLDRWGVKVVESHMDDGLLMMASTEKIMKAVKASLDTVDWKSGD